MTRFFTLVLASVVLGSACSTTPIGVPALAGRYELRSVNGRAVPVDALGGALSGEIHLGTDGRAMRVVRHATSGIPGPIEIRATGTYRVHGSRITLELDETRARGQARRRQVVGEVRPPLLVIRYPGPTEGIVEERYVRTTP